MKKLSIVITHYQEPVEVFTPLLDSLRLQRGIDWKDIEILFVQDGKTAVLDASFFSGYELPIRYIEAEKGGISRVRNRGIDEAVGEYIVFCDCDDIFQSVFGLHLIFSAMQEDPDIIGSKFVEENKYVSPYSLIGHDNDITFIHGKAFKKEFLDSYGLRFHTELTKHEDGVFVCLAYQLAKKTKYINTPFYLWCWNPNSVMRTIGVKQALLATYPELMASRAQLMRDFKVYGIELPKHVAKCVIDAYYDFQKNEFSDANNSDQIERAIEAFCNFYKEFREEYMETDASDLAQVMMASRALAYQNGMAVERMTLNQFLNLIKQELNGK